MRNRHEDRSLRGRIGHYGEDNRERQTYGQGREDDRDREWSTRDSDMRSDMRGRGHEGGSMHEGRGGYAGHGMHEGRGGYEGRAHGYGEGGYGGGWGGQREHGGMGDPRADQDTSRQWGRDRDRYDRDFSGRDYDRERNLGGRDYETRHFGGGRGGGFERSERGEYRGAGMMGSGGEGGYGASSSYGAYSGSHGYGGYGGYGGSGGFGGPSGVGGYGARGGGAYGRPGVGMGVGGGAREGWGQAIGGSDLGFGSPDHEGRDLRDLRDNRGPHYGKGPKGYKRSDDRIREDVCDCIAQQGRVDATDVEVNVSGGVVTLTGTVGERHHKRMLEQLVEQVRGVDEVHNELRLRREQAEQGRAGQAQVGQTQAGQTGQTGQTGHGNGGDPTRGGHPNGKTARA